MKSLDALYTSFRARCEALGWPSPTDLGALSPDRQSQLDRLLRRLALASALQTDDPFPPLERSAGPSQVSALRLYLLLTCVDQLAQAWRTDRFLDFKDWLAIHDEEVATQRIRALEAALGDSGGKIESVQALSTVVTSTYDEYKRVHGFRTSFYRFFQECLDPDLRDQIVAQCWVYRDNPLVPWGALHLVQAGYNERRTPDLARLSDARARWDGFGIEERLRQIGRVCEYIRNDYTHGLLPTPVTGDRNPIFEDTERATAAAILMGAVTPVTEEEFTRLAQAEGGSGTWFSVRAVLHNGTLFPVAVDLSDKELNPWLEEVLARCHQPYDRGDTVFLWSHRLALATSAGALTTHLHAWLDNAISRLLLRDSNI